MIRLMTIEDMPKVLAIENEVFTSCWNEAEFKFEVLENEFSSLYVLEINGEVIGYSGLYQLFERAEILTLAVSKKYQGKGYGKMLLQHLIDEAIKNESEVISLEVRVSNKVAINLYEKFGFITMRTRKSYYQDNHEDAYEMAKALGGLYEEDLCD